MTTPESRAGAFRQSLLRNNTEIRQDRAESLADDAETMYRRQIENLELELRKLQREREDLLDLSPTDADSLVLAADFDAEAYAVRDLALSVRMRNTGIRHELALARYRILFGDDGPRIAEVTNVTNSADNTDTTKE